MDLVPPCFDKYDSKFIFHYDPAGLQQAITEAVAADKMHFILSAATASVIACCKPAGSQWKMNLKSQEEARADDADFDMSAPAA